MVDVIAVESSIDIDKSEVWDALVDPTVRARWWPTIAFEPVLGAPISETATDGISARGTVRNVVPHQRLEFTWSGSGWAAETTVVLSLLEDDGKTVVRIREHGFESADRSADDAERHTSGWRRRLSSLTETLRTRS